MHILCSKRYLCPLHLLSYTLEIDLFIMELQWPEYLIKRTFQMHVSTFTLLHVYNTKLGPFSLHIHL